MREAAQSSKLRTVSIDTRAEQDWPSVRRIYEEGIVTGNATFEKSAGCPRPFPFWSVALVDSSMKWVPHSCLVWGGGE